MSKTANTMTPPNQDIQMERRRKLYGYSVVAASTLAIFSLFGYRATFGVLKGAMSADMGWNQSEVALGYSLMMLCYAISAVFWGMMLDKIGAKLNFFVGSFLAAGGFYFTSLADSLYTYYAAFGLLSGLATGMLWVSSTITVRKWFVGKDYAKMFGFAFAGAPLATIIMNLFVKQSLVNASGGDGWRDALQVLAIITLVLLLLAAFITKKAPENYGMKPFGQLENASGERIWSAKEAFSTFPVWGAILVFLTAMLGEFLIWTQVVSYWTTDLGMPLGKAANIFMAIGFLGLVFMPVLGGIADKVVQKSEDEIHGRKRMLIYSPIAGMLCTVILLIQGFSPTGFGILFCVPFAAYWAIFSGGVYGYVGAVYGRVSLGKIAGIMSCIVMGTGPFLGPLIGGYLKDLTGSYQYSMVFALCAFTLSMLLATRLPRSVKAND
ncbi:MFS transporter [Desulfovibrio sp. Fe33]|uniref:MFS transporter n=1 Tax=Desulfovibrio sp. Fe33 TaxID=3020842 RepID=UPI00234C5940|nr:MFS transporter [Desulfovibrio sp. Fe33]